MMRFLTRASLLAVIASTVVSASADEECGIYLAVSSTSTVEEPKWGLYAGQEISKGGGVGFGEIAIHTFHLLAIDVISCSYASSGLGVVPTP